MGASWGDKKLKYIVSFVVNPIFWQGKNQNFATLNSFLNATVPCVFAHNLLQKPLTKQFLFSAGQKLWVNTCSSAIIADFEQIYAHSKEHDSEAYTVFIYLWALRQLLFRLNEKPWLTLPALCIPESSIKIKINRNFYFHTSLWYLKRFYEGP